MKCYFYRLTTEDRAIMQRVYRDLNERNAMRWSDRGDARTMNEYASLSANGFSPLERMLAYGR